MTDSQVMMLILLYGDLNVLKPPIPGQGEFILAYGNVMSLGASFPNMTHELIVSKDDDTENDMTEWIKSVQPGDIITIREFLLHKIQFILK